MLGSHHNRRRDTPPGEGDPMEDIEYQTVTYHTVWTVTGDLKPQDLGFDLMSLDGSSLVSSERHSDTGPVEMDWREILAQDPDNPPVREGGNATSIGIELEFLVAVCRASEDIPDPLRKDHRWLTDSLINESPESSAFKYTVRNKIIDRLSANGIVANKTNEKWWESGEQLMQGDDEPYLGKFFFGWWDSLEYEQENPAILQWLERHKWLRAGMDGSDIPGAAEVLRAQFMEYLERDKMRPFTISMGALKSIRDKLSTLIQGELTATSRKSIMQRWYESVSLFVNSENEDYCNSHSVPVDPLAVPDMGVADPRYLVWSCKEDWTVSTSIPPNDCYNIRSGKIPLMPDGKPGEVTSLYKWFGAEVISPVMDYDNPGSRTALISTCTVLRGEFRIHKPMEFIQSGVHVHIGQQAGWTLLHLKKFATLWHLIEPFMYRFHRKDRRKSAWCKPLATECNLAKLVFRRGLDTDKDSLLMPTTTGALSRAYAEQMSRYVPNIQDHDLVSFMSIIWQYPEIDQLNLGMSGGPDAGTTIRWRLAGSNLTSPTGPNVKTQTLEFRLMQGTLDADHIWKWASICERLVIFARDSTPAQFRGTIKTLLKGHAPFLTTLGMNEEDLTWFMSRSNGLNDDVHFIYPDLNGKINWHNPFMTTGYQDTHDLRLNDRID
ncbi:hypothetical protein F4808DRAFT_474317 [Astrocystis sublimbata]|nr:hypothetical protein F4808DRAFT_474317 [Astrocystis sublimbata]